MDDLRQFLAALRAEEDLLEIEAEADPRLEIPEIHRRVIAQGGPALLFRRPKGSSFPVVTNLFGTAKRIDLAFGKRPLDFVKTAIGAGAFVPVGHFNEARAFLLGKTNLARKEAAAPLYDTSMRPEHFCSGRRRLNPGTD